MAKKCRRKLEQVKEAARRLEASENARHTQRSSKKIKIGWNMPNDNWPYDKNSTHGCQSSTSFGGSFDCFAENLKSKSKSKSKLKENASNHNNNINDNKNDDNNIDKDSNSDGQVRSRCPSRIHLGQTHMEQQE